MAENKKSELQPTLWRTCRAMANRKRLKIVGLIVEHPGLSVSAVAARLHIGVPQASEDLRTLNARSLLTPRRRSRWVHYYPGATYPNGGVRALALALHARFRQSRGAVEAVFRLATAFTHPRRADILRALKRKPQTLGELAVATDISRAALLRHLRKLETRGFIAYRGLRRRVYKVRNHPDPLGRALASLC